MNYPQIMSPVLFASKSGSHVSQLLWERRPWQNATLRFERCGYSRRNL